jgi:hypothetical protein
MTEQTALEIVKMLKDINSTLVVNGFVIAIILMFKNMSGGK